MQRWERVGSMCKVVKIQNDTKTKKQELQRVSPNKTVNIIHLNILIINKSSRYISL